MYEKRKYLKNVIQSHNLEMFFVDDIMDEVINGWIIAWHLSLTNLV